MLLHSILKALKLESAHPESAGAEKPGASGTDKGEKKFSGMIEDAKIPAGEATYEAAGKAAGLRKFELAVAAEAGLLRPMIPDPPEHTDQPGQSFEELLRTIEDLKNPGKSHKLDLFE